MYWDKRGILKIYNFCRRGRRNSPHFVRHISQGRFSFRKRTAPARPQENARGYRPLTPELPILNFISAAVCKCTGAAQPRLLPLSIWSASMSAHPLLRRGYGGAQRFAAAAAGLRKASAFGDTAFLREKAVRKRARGCRPLTPELPILNFISAAVCEYTGAAQPRLLPLSIWSAPMSAQPLLRRGYGGAQRFADRMVKIVIHPLIRRHFFHLSLAF